MGLEHAHEIMNGREISILRRSDRSSETRLAMLQAELVFDLIEEIRWLRNDLNNLNQNKMAKQ
ncbi:MAG: hypothetical protein ACXV4C_09110 [Halobacteriota archaeon]